MYGQMKFRKTTMDKPDRPNQLLDEMMEVTMKYYLKYTWKSGRVITHWFHTKKDRDIYIVEMKNYPIVSHETWEEKVCDHKNIGMEVAQHIAEHFDKLPDADQW